MNGEVNGIIDLNSDMESYVIQASASRTVFFRSKFEDKYDVLEFLHFSDVHACRYNWDRVVEYLNYYKDYISFALHTGDYCEDNQESYADLYGEGIASERVIYNCIGNHDTNSVDQVTHVRTITSNDKPYALLFNHTEGWDVCFQDRPNSMNYYNDFEKSNVRMIVLDLYYDVELQKKWLAEVLDDAREKGLYVITAMHEQTAHIVESYGVTFNSINDYDGLLGKEGKRPYEDTIAEFVKAGGVHICHFAGHSHHDKFGITEQGILNSVVPCATTWCGWSDGKRVMNTKTQDCFNVVSIDPNLGLLKLIRIGDNSDHFLRPKRLLCFDYVNRRVIYNE